jgi:hypothetical protein
MASFLFVGDPRHGGDGKGEISFMGYTFNRTKPVHVDESDDNGKMAVFKLRGNNHFVESEDNEGESVVRRGRPPKTTQES